MHIPELLAAWNIALFSVFYEPGEGLSELKKKSSKMASNLLDPYFKLQSNRYFLIKFKERKFGKIKRLQNVQEFELSGFKLFGLIKEIF